MVKAVDEMLKNLESLAPDPAIVSTCPELPGIVLDQVLAKAQSRDDSDYQEVTRHYNAMRSEYLRALVAHPVARALALLAVGMEGVAMLEAGRTPCAVSEVSSQPKRSLRSRREPYNCHHVIPKSLKVAEGAAAINHPANLVMAKTSAEAAISRRIHTIAGTGSCFTHRPITRHLRRFPFMSFDHSFLFTRRSHRVSDRWRSFAKD